MDWYYMRKKVIATHVLSELYMLTDKSPGFSSTEEFVDRRLEDFAELEKFGEYVKQFSKIIKFFLKKIKIFLDWKFFE